MRFSFFGSEVEKSGDSMPPDPNFPTVGDVKFGGEEREAKMPRNLQLFAHAYRFEANKDHHETNSFV